MKKIASARDSFRTGPVRNTVPAGGFLALPNTVPAVWEIDGKNQVIS
jgi:hypothetical protein